MNCRDTQGTLPKSHTSHLVSHHARNHSASRAIKPTRTLLLTLAFLLSGCAVQKFTQEPLPTALHVQIGHVVTIETVASGNMIYQCRTKKDSLGFDWTLIDIEAILKNRDGKKVGRYFGPPATWQVTDGSMLTATLVATTPAASTLSGAIPHALYQAKPATGKGVMTAVTYIQQIATNGGAVPAGCDQTSLDKKQTVDFQADFIFYKAN